MRSKKWSTGCWRRPPSASAGAATGSTWPAMANRPARRATCPIRTPGVIATTSSTPFNADKPYDRFIREQIAGDLLPAASQAERDEQLIATGFLALGVKDVNQRFKVRFVMDNIDEQIDTVSRAFLGLTASCARCHDHKFDPIPTSRLLRPGRHLPQHRAVCGRAEQDGRRRPRLLRHADARGAGRHRASRSSPTPRRPRRSTKRSKALAEARAEFEALRGKPEGNEPGADGRPKRAIAREKMTRLQNALARPDRPRHARHGGTGRARMPPPSATPRSASAARPRSSARACRADS